MSPLSAAVPPTTSRSRVYWPYYATAGAWRARRRDELRRTVVLSGSPRSGTTWLSDIMARLTGWPLMQEPTLPRRVPEMIDRFGWDGRPYREPGVEDPALAEALERVVTGTYLGPGLIFRNRRNDTGLWARRPMISKLTNVNLLLPWMTDALPWLRVVQIVRHPLATVASQQHKEDSYWARSTDLSQSYRRFFAAQPAYAAPLDYPTPEEASVARWAVEHAWLRDRQADLGGVAWLRYEDLRADLPTQLRRLAELAGVAPPADDTPFRQPSRSVTAGASTLADATPDAGWKRHFTDAQLDRVRAILAHYDHPFYGPETLA